MRTRNARSKPLIMPADPFATAEQCWVSCSMQVVMSSDLPCAAAAGDIPCLASEDYAQGHVVERQPASGRKIEDFIDSDGDGELPAGIVFAADAEPYAVFARPDWESADYARLLAWLGEGPGGAGEQRAIREIMGTYRPTVRTAGCLPSEFFSHEAWKCEPDDTALASFASTWGVMTSPLRLAGIELKPYEGPDGERLAVSNRFGVVSGELAEVVQENAEGISQTDSVRRALIESYEPIPGMAGNCSVWNEGRNTSECARPVGPVIVVSAKEMRASLSLVRYLTEWAWALVKAANADEYRLARMRVDGSDIPIGAAFARECALAAHDNESSLILDFLNRIPMQRDALVARHASTSGFAMPEPPRRYDANEFIRAVLSQMAHALGDASMQWKACSAAGCRRVYKTQHAATSTAQHHRDAVYCSKRCAGNQNMRDARAKGPSKRGRPKPNR